MIISSPCSSHNTELSANQCNLHVHLDHLGKIMMIMMTIKIMMYFQLDHSLGWFKASAIGSFAWQILPKHSLDQQAFHLRVMYSFFKNPSFYGFSQTVYCGSLDPYPSKVKDPQRSKEDEVDYDDGDNDDDEDAG